MISTNLLQAIRASCVVLLTLFGTTPAAAAAEDHASSPPSTQPGRVVISGTVPDEATKAAILGKLQQLYGNGQVVDQIAVGGVIAPPNW
jgi:OOP family OmpA-OmpF porin